MSRSLEADLARVVGRLPGAELRPGQLQMAQAVEEALAQGRHLVVQAGTGTGKSLAYLVPAVRSGLKVVVATATLALQDQLARKDLPLVGCRWALLKGRANYLCRQKLDELGAGAAQAALQLGGPCPADELARLAAWAATTDSGDRAELDFEPSARAWAAVSTTARECPGAAACPAGDRCFAEAARDRAAQADVVVVNTHLYCSHLAAEAPVLPDHQAVVFDEAHELEDAASAALGVELSPGRLAALARAALPLVGPAGRRAAEELAEAGQALSAAAGPWRGRRLQPGSAPQLDDALVAAQARLARVAALLRQGSPSEPARARALLGAAWLAADLERLAGPGEDHVAWVEGPDPAPVVRLAPLDVGRVLAERLWPQVGAVLTSATVPPGLAGRLGLPPERLDQLEVPSPFPYATHALLYCAAHLPDRRRPEAEGPAHDELCQLVSAAGGRTLALFTSWRAMGAAVEVARRRLPYPVLAQGDAPRDALLEAFSADEQACLFATTSFWQGVDVPGPSLALVVIDRIPFPRPDDPLLEARRARAGPEGFRAVDLPRAATLLAQGAGRLVRSSADRGVVAVLDPRLATASYRWDLVRALPPMARTSDPARARDFLARAAGGP
ncbi:MAG TPA: ATP-dependent DNA helicase [Acidimicrobiales bacterium]|nr:ATP-dependent DNA helicase [Acidimicrobiales bacterium]